MDHDFNCFFQKKNLQIEGMIDDISDSQLIAALAQYITDVVQDHSEVISDDFDIYTKNLKAHFFGNSQLFKKHFTNGYELLREGIKD